MYTSDEERPEDLLPALADESRRTWLTDGQTDSLHTVVATQILWMTEMADGQNGIVLEYLDGAARMGERLGLFGMGERLRSADISNPDVLLATSLGAWSTFTWIV